MKYQRLFAIIGIFIIAVVLAFPLRDAVYSIVIIPVAYIMWLLDLIYQLVSQVVWWLVVIVLVIVIFSKSLLPETKVIPREWIKGEPIVGPIEDLSVWMKKSRKGVYFQWLVANRLGKVAYQILSRHDIGKKRTVFDELTSPGWEAEPDVQEYLEAGLQGSFTDYAKRETTPLDHDVSETIDYLEEQIENH